MQQKFAYSTYYWKSRTVFTKLFTVLATKKGLFLAELMRNFLETKNYTKHVTSDFATLTCMKETPEIDWGAYAELVAIPLIIMLLSQVTD